MKTHAWTIVVLVALLAPSMPLAHGSAAAAIPGAPFDLTADDGGAHSIALSWRPPADAPTGTTYRVWHATAPGAWALLAETTETNHLHQNIASDAQQRYRVTAVAPGASEDSAASAIALAHVGGATLPSNVARAGSAWTGSELLVFAGSGILAYDPATLAARQLAGALPAGLSGVGVAWSGTHAYLFGGYTSAAWKTDTVYRYDPATETLDQLPAKLPSARNGAVAAWHGDSAYVYGGTVGGNYQVAYRDDVLRYTPGTGSLTRIGSLPTGWVAAAAASWEGDMFLLSGRRCPDRPGSSVYCAYPPDVVRHAMSSTKTSDLLDRLPLGLTATSAAAVATENAILLVGGAMGSNAQPTADVVRFDPATARGERVAELPHSREGPVAAWHNGVLHVLGGLPSCDTCPGRRDVTLHPSLPSAPATVAGAPGPNLGAATLTWAPASSGFAGDALVGYRVYRVAADGEEMYLAQVDAASRQFTDTGLPTDTTVRYRVRALAQAGEGAAADVEIRTWKATVPPAVPDLLASAGPEVGSVTLQWSAPRDDGGQPPTGYRFYAAPTGMPLAVVDEGGATRSVILRGLENDTAYDFAVAPLNEAGEGPIEVSSTARTFVAEPPGAPRDVRATPGPGLGEVTLAWRAPVTGEEPPVELFRVWLLGGETWRLLAEVGQSARSYTHTDLVSPLAERHYRIEAVNPVGAGPPGEAAGWPWPADAVRDGIGSNARRE